MINIVIINTQKQDSDKLVTLLSLQQNMQLLAHGKDGYDALKLIGGLKPDIAIVDYQLDYIDGEEISPLLKIRSPSTAIVILAAARISDYQLRRAVVNAVSGFICKETDMETLSVILTTIAEGGCFISPLLACRILRLLASPDQNGRPLCHKTNLSANSAFKKQRYCGYSKIFSKDDPAGYLSKTELNILTSIGKGHTSDEIAKNQSLAIGTVRNYTSSIMHKIGLSNRSQMVLYAINYGLLSLDKQ